MEAYAQVLLIAIPFFLVLILIEFLYGWYKGKQTFRSMDTISSLSSGITNTLKSVLGLILVIISYSWMVEHFAVVNIKTTWLVYVVGFIAIDFAGYCTHRLSHSINYFWNHHVVHHSSEEFNLACALRQSISEFFGVTVFFLIPAALLGVPEQVIGTLAPLHLFLQFWYHTRHIPKLGFIEYLIVTPSQHRVHHAINDIYLDKNMGQIFPWWDRLFGTFQEELDEAPPVYGVKKAPNTWNPIKINFQHLWLLMQDAWRAKSWKDKLRIWFMPTGWRPADVQANYPIEVITDPYHYKKYHTSVSKQLHWWSWFQFILANILLTDMLIRLADIGFPLLFLYGGFIFLLIYAYSELMDKNPNAIWFEIVKSLFGLAIIYQTNDWFFLNQHFPFATTLMAFYMIVSVVIVGLFIQREIKVGGLSIG